MLNSVDAGRRMMLRAAVYPLAAIAALALVFFLLKGANHALGALASGLAVVSGGWLAARTALGGGVQGAAPAVVRLVLAMVLKWVVVIVVLALGFIVWKLPAVALLAGVAVGMMFQVLALARR